MWGQRVPHVSASRFPAPYKSWFFLYIPLYGLRSMFTRAGLLTLLQKEYWPHFTGEETESQRAEVLGTGQNAYENIPVLGPQCSLLS